MNRTLKLPVLIALALGSAPAMALGLGHIQVKSSLDKPLLAEIPLTADYPGETKHVTVKLASAADFRRAGLNRSQLGADLHFQVVTEAGGQKVIRITTNRPVRDTYLDFLIQVSWSKGKMLREYTVLLDPSSMAGSPPQGQATSAGSGSRSAQAASAGQPSAAAQQQATARAAASSPSTVAGGKYGPVRSGQTLSGIAQSTRPGGVSQNQMLIALYRANPGAFYRHNINALKRGAVLRIPSRQQAQSEGRAQALAEVRRQDADWNGTKASSPTMVSDTGAAPKSGGGTGQAAKAQDRLSLVPPEKGGSGSGHGGVKGGTGSASIDKLKADLSRTRESLSNLQQKNSDLKSRVDSLQSIEDKNQKLLSLKDSQIAELQQKLAQARKAAGKAPLPAASVGTAPAAAPVAAASVKAPQNATAKAAATPGKATPSAAASSPTQANAKHVPAPAAPKASPAHPKHPASAPHHTPKPASGQGMAVMSWFRQPWAKIAGGAALVLLLLLAWLGVRRRRSTSPTRPSLADQFGDSPFPAGGGDANTMDDDQRELMDQLAEHPDDVGLHLELVSLYYARRDVEGFEGAAEAMYAHVTDPDQAEWQDVVAMGRDLTPGHPLFAEEEGEASQGHDMDASADVFDLDSYVSEHDAEDIDEDIPDSADAAFSATESTEDDDASGYSFDFDLTPGTDRTEAESDSVPEAPSESDYDALPPLPEDDGMGILPDAGTDEEVATGTPAVSGGAGDEFGEVEDVSLPADESATDEPLSDDPVDTKLDLARAYIDMGDPEGARAMLEEVMDEGSQMQKDMAGKLLEDIG